MSNLNFKADFTRLSFADLQAIHIFSKNYIYELNGKSTDEVNKNADFFSKVHHAAYQELQCRIIEKFSEPVKMMSDFWKETETRRTLPNNGVAFNSDKEYIEFMKSRL